MKKESDFTSKMYQRALRNMSNLLKRFLEGDAVSEKEKRMAEEITRIILDNPGMESDRETPLQEWQIRELAEESFVNLSTGGGESDPESSQYTKIRFIYTAGVFPGHNKLQLVVYP